MEKIILPKISGRNLRYNLNVDLELKKYSITLYDWGVEEELEQNYQRVKSKYNSGELKMGDILFDENLVLFIEHLLYDLHYELKNNKLTPETFIDQSYAIISVFYFVEFESKKSENDDRLYLNCTDLLLFYSLNGRFDYITNIVQSGRLKYTFGEIHALELVTKKRVVTPAVLFANMKIYSSLNTTVAKKKVEFYGYLEEKLGSIYKGHYSFYKSFFNEEKTITEINKPFPQKYNINSFLGANAKEKRIAECFDYIEKNKENPKLKKYFDILTHFSNGESNKYIDNIWNSGDLWLRYDESPFTTNDHRYYFVHFVESIVRKVFISIILGSQSEFRESIGLPKIGEGWVSETNLFNAVNHFFDSEEVVHHGSPKWLGKQHLDVYLPKFNIAIEYQGKQHSEPIEIFGGHEGFLKTLERDKRKKKLCKENGCLLLYVYPETDTDEFLIKLEKEAKKRS